MRVDAVDWGDELDDREEHVAKHGVSPTEVEDVLFGTHWQRRGRGRAIEVFGRTPAGRPLFVVVRQRPHRTAYVITARDMTPAERRLFERSSR